MFGNMEKTNELIIYSDRNEYGEDYSDISWCPSCNCLHIKAFVDLHTPTICKQIFLTA